MDAIRFETLHEAEQAGGWKFLVESTQGEEQAEHAIMLSWSDYNHWSPSGADRPCDVACAVLRFLAGRDELRLACDASIARRLFADADEVIPTLIGR